MVNIPLSGARFLNLQRLPLRLWFGTRNRLPVVLLVLLLVLLRLKRGEPASTASSRPAHPQGVPSRDRLLTLFEFLTLGIEVINGIVSRAWVAVHEIAA